jgi:PAS domain-containing protein
MDRQGVVIMDADGEIRLLTPVAEDLLGWRPEQATGLSCAMVFDCRDSYGRSLCAQCGLQRALEQKSMTPSVSARMADPFGQRREMSLNFWYLPPCGRFYQPRLMAIISRETDSAASAAPTTAGQE